MKVTWEVDDGYVGGSRPQTTEIQECDIEDCDSIEEAMQVVNDIIQEDYEQTITWYMDNKEKIKTQVQKILDSREEEDV